MLSTRDAARVLSIDTPGIPAHILKSYANSHVLKEASSLRGGAIVSLSSRRSRLLPGDLIRRGLGIVFASSGQNPRLIQ